MDELTQQNITPTTPTQSAGSPSPTPTPAETQVHVTPTPAPPATTPASPAETPASQNAIFQMIMENKRIVIIGLIAVVAIIIGLSVFIGAKSSSEYQGLIKRIDTQTQELTKASQAPQPTITAPQTKTPETTTKTTTTTPAPTEILPVTTDKATQGKVQR